jgi:hypothetical protein
VSYTLLLSLIEFIANTAHTDTCCTSAPVCPLREFNIMSYTLLLSLVKITAKHLAH